MRVPPFRSLQVRLMALVFGMVMRVWTGASVMTWYGASHELDELLDAHLAQATALLVVQQAGADDDAMEDALSLHKYASRVAFQVFHEGRVVMRSSNAEKVNSHAALEMFTSGQLLFPG